MIIGTTNDIAAIDAIYGEVVGLTERSRDIGASFTATLQSAPLAL